MERFLITTFTCDQLFHMVCNIYFYLHYDQSENMTNKWHVYMTKDGRISLAGLSLAKCEYLADAIIDSYHNVN